MICALIMAGGQGTRFWPLSTEEKPKQFLKLLGEDTMLQMTVNRLEKLIPIEQIFVVTGRRYVSLVKEQLTELPDRNIIIEPIGKNTAPCVALSAFHINRIYNDATIVVLPSDHLINDEKKYINVIKIGCDFVDENKDAIVTIGMKPDRPETGYGYIKSSKASNSTVENSIVSVERFVEKPNLEKAREYLEDGSYLWNGGMFIWKAVNILRLTCMHLENTYNVLSEIATANEEEYEKVLERKYNEVESISVDYGIMEKADNIFVIPSDFGWDDVGNWTSLERYREKDKNGNVITDNCFTYESEGNIAITNKKILLNNVKNLIVVETDEYILISTKENEQEIKLAKETIC